MNLKNIYEKVYKKVFSVPMFDKLLRKMPFLEKLLGWEIVSYVLFGVLSTVVNMVSYWLLNLPAGKGYETKILFPIGKFDIRWIYLSNTVAWLITVLFAFVTNKLFVFESRGKSKKETLREFISFIGARILTLVLFDELLFILLTRFLNSWIVKIIVMVFVVIFNYIASKLVIFRKTKESNQ